jgi:hypothetical protein
MKPFWVPAIIFLTLYLGFVAYVGATAELLPERAATHFGVNGRADGWMGRAEYTTFISLLGLGLPAFTAVMGLLTRFLPAQFVNIPHRDYWLAPERRPETSAYLLRQCLWLACLLVGFVGWMHYLTIVANRSTPVGMPSQMLWGGLAVFLAGLGVWIALMVAHFRKPA